MRIALFAFLLGGAVAIAPAPAALALQAAPAACGHIPPDPDVESFASPGDAERLGQGTAANFGIAANQLCLSRALRPADLAAFSRLVVRKTETAAEPTVYDDAEQGPDALIIEYAFAGGSAPSPAALETAIRCWREPTRAGCDQAID